MGENRHRGKRGSTIFCAAVGLAIALTAGCKTAPTTTSAAIPELTLEPRTADLSLDEARILEESVESTNVVPDVEPPRLDP